jgi:hypothetical protein
MRTRALRPEDQRSECIENFTQATWRRAVAQSRL